MARRRLAIELDREMVVRLWLARQGLLAPRTQSLTKPRLIDHLERTGGLQLDSINVVDRAHYLTLWSRFGTYRRPTLDRWVYDEGAGYEYWGHEASILPLSHLPFGRRRMRSFPPRSWAKSAWWSRYETSLASKRRVLRRLRQEGPLESTHFAAGPGEAGSPDIFPLVKEDKRSLKTLWHRGRVAVTARRHFRCVYDLAERVLPAGPTATTRQYQDSWLATGLSGNGVAPARHLNGYFTAPELSAADKRAVIARNLKRGTIVKVRVSGAVGEWYAQPEQLKLLEQPDRLPAPTGTTLLSPFDSLLWQRARATELLDFDYKVEIYVPPAKREFGYYAMPILHDGRLVGRVDPKLHRDRGVLEIRAIGLEPGFKSDAGFRSGLAASLENLAAFLAASEIELPRGWR